MRVVSEQRKRLIASILSAAESSPWWRRLSADEKSAYRDKVITSVGVFYDLCRDVIKVTEEDGVRNEYAIELIEQIHSKVGKA